MKTKEADLQHEEGYLAYVIPDELLPAATIEGLQVGPPAQRQHEADAIPWLQTVMHKW